jgi:hypothetical protein
MEMMIIKESQIFLCFFHRIFALRSIPSAVPANSVIRRKRIQRIGLIPFSMIRTVSPVPQTGDVSTISKEMLRSSAGKRIGPALSSVICPASEDADDEMAESCEDADCDDALLEDAAPCGGAGGETVSGVGRGRRFVAGGRVPKEDELLELDALLVELEDPGISPSVGIIR